MTYAVVVCCNLFFKLFITCVDAAKFYVSICISLTMEKEHIKSLQSNHMYLLDNVMADDATDLLYQEGILTTSDLDTLEGLATQKEKCRKLLHILQTKGPSAMEVFVLFVVSQIICLFIYTGSVMPLFHQRTKPRSCLGPLIVDSR